MKLNEFVTGVLNDIEAGLTEAEKNTNKKYFITDSNNIKGVLFDVAVTTTLSNNAMAEGKANAGIIQVLGAGVGGKMETNKENSEASRIQFTVFIPTLTKGEETARYSKLNQNQESWEI